MSDSPFSLHGRVALVTGATRGLGRVAVTALAEAGADVVVCSRRQEACHEVAQEIASRTGVRAEAAACHVGHWDECAALMDQVLDRFGRLDVLVNNAGMSPTYDSLEDVSEELFDKVIGVNLKGPFRLSVLAAAQMVTQPSGGSIVNVSSIAAVRPRAGELPYAVAKAGLNTLTTGLAHAYGPNVRANAIMAGPFLTDVSRHWDMADFERRAATEIPLRRAGEPSEIAAAVLYLASDAASFTTGAVIKIDGGLAWSPA